MVVETLWSPIVRALEYCDASPLLIGDAGAGAWAIRTIARIDTPLDGSAPVIEIGDSGDHDRLMRIAAGGQADPKTADVYVNYALHQYTSLAPVKAYIAPDGSTAGEAVVLA